MMVRTMADKKLGTLRAFACRVAGSKHESIINARSAGKAKYQYFLDISDVLPDLKITDLRARSLGGPHSSEGFVRNAHYRGMPTIRCGARVKVGDSCGVIVAHNESANFDVLFDPGSKWGEHVVNVHPSEIEVLHKSHS